MVSRGAAASAAGEHRRSGAGAVALVDVVAVRVGVGVEAQGAAAGILLHMEEQAVAIGDFSGLADLVLLCVGQRLGTLDRGGDPAVVAVAVGN